MSMLTVYVVLLFAIPSNLTIGALGSLGRPSFLWGLFLFGWWSLAQLQTSSFSVRPAYQPIKLAFGFLLVVVLVSLAAALLRGQPGDQVSPAITGVARFLSWGGVLLVAVDGVRTMSELSRLVRRLAIAGGLLAALGIAQFASGHVLIDFYTYIPGLTADGGGVDARGDFTRSSGTATHPLEYATALSATLPLAVATAISHGFPNRRGAVKWVWWVPVGLIAISSFLAVSRSAIIGFAVAMIAMIPGLPRRYRAPVITGGAVMAGIIVLLVPGLFGTMVGLFSSAGSDASTTSRVNGLDRAPEFIATSPIFGNGFGTFLPRYYIFDNAWILIAVELGIAGIIGFAALLATGIWSAYSAANLSTHADTVLVSRALAASVLTVAILLAFFDGLSFPIAAGLAFLLVGLCGAARSVGVADAQMAPRGSRILTEEDDE